MRAPSYTIPQLILRGLPLLLLLLVGEAAGAMQGGDPRPDLFPEARHAELREDIQYVAPDEKKEKEQKEALDEMASDLKDWSVSDIKLSKPVLYTLLAVMIALIAGFVIYALNGYKFRRSTRVDQATGEVDIEEIEEEEMVAKGVSLSLLERAEQAGQFAIAIRLLYIQLLKELQDAGLIRYRRDLSNRDYHRQLAGRAELEEVRTVTQDYERHWFGNYSVDALTYRLIKQRFVALAKRLHPLSNPAVDV